MFVNVTSLLAICEFKNKVVMLVRINCFAIVGNQTVVVDKSFAS